MSHSIDEVSARTGISKHTLRYYEREGLLAPVTKGANGHRRYTEDDLGRLGMLQLLRATGMPIREMKDFVRLTEAGDHTIGERVAVLHRVRAGLLARMMADAEHLAWLDRKIDYYGGVLELGEVAASDAGTSNRPVSA